MKRPADKCAFVADYFSHHCEDEDIFLSIHALFNCLSDEEITTMYFDYVIAEPELKKSLESYIVKRTTNPPLRKFNKIANKLLSVYHKESYDIQRRIRMFLSSFIRTTSPEITRKFYDIFITSERMIDRRRAGEVADLIWCDEVEGKLWDNYYRYKDEDSLIPLARNLNADDLCQLMEKCWTPKFPSYRLKNSLLEKISSLPSNRLMFLKVREPAYFVRAMAIQGKKIERKIIRDLGKTLPIDQRQFLVWYAGLTGDWNLVKQYIRK